MPATVSHEHQKKQKPSNKSHYMEAANFWQETVKNSIGKAESQDMLADEQIYTENTYISTGTIELKIDK